MQVHSEKAVLSDWYNEIARQISVYKDSLDKKDYKKYKLDLLMRLAGRIDSFSAICGECQMFKQDISRLSQDINYSMQVSGTIRMSGDERKSYNRTINTITKHLQKQHKLVTEGYYTGIGSAIGTGIGVAIGAALGNPGIGAPIGIGIGLAIGRYLDNKAKKESRII